MSRTVYIGHDASEAAAFDVAQASIRRRSSVDVTIVPLVASVLQRQGLLSRLVDSRGGKLYDLASNAPCSTEFSISRFLVPLLGHHGWALFMDCDMVVLADIEELFSLADPDKAVMVVKHNHVPTEKKKMGGAVQTAYSRKNWSSVVLWNCTHPANLRLTLGAINSWPGRDLHAFGWLHDDEIGELPSEWNWLVNVQPKPAVPKIAHFTLGGPFTPGWTGAPNDELWLSEAAQT